MGPKTRSTQAWRGADLLGAKDEVHPGVQPRRHVRALQRRPLHPHKLPRVPPRPRRQHHVPHRRAVGVPPPQRQARRVELPAKAQSGMI